MEMKSTSSRLGTHIHKVFERHEVTKKPFAPHVRQIKDHHIYELYMQQHKGKITKKQHTKAVYNLTVKA